MQINEEVLYVPPCTFPWPVWVFSHSCGVLQFLNPDNIFMFECHFLSCMSDDSLSCFSMPLTASIRSANANQGLWSALSNPMAINGICSVRIHQSRTSRFTELWWINITYYCLIHVLTDCIFGCFSTRKTKQNQTKKNPISFVLLSASDCTIVGVTLLNVHSTWWREMLTRFWRTQNDCKPAI